MARRSREGTGKSGCWTRTAQPFETFVQVLDLTMVDATDIGHEISHLNEKPPISKHKETREPDRSIAYLSSTIGHLLVDVMIAENGVD